MTDELDVILPINKTITINDESIEIHPYKFGQLNKVVKAAEPLFVHLKTVDTSGTNEEVGAELLKVLLTEGGSSIAEVIAISVNKPTSWVENLEVDQVIELASTVFEVNKDFFTKKIAPLLSKVIEK